MSENCFSRIASTGSFLPKRAVSNEELAQDLAKIGVETSDEWIRTARASNSAILLPVKSPPLIWPPRLKTGLGSRWFFS